MTEFGDFLKKQIDQIGESISAVARGTGIERTSLSKAINGDRNLPYYTLKKLISYLHLSPYEQEILYEYYNMQIQGEERFESRKIIVRLLGVLSNLSFSEYKYRKNDSLENIEVFEKEGSFYSGKYTVHNIMRRMIDQELEEKHPGILLFLPTDDEFLMYYFYNIFSEYVIDIEVQHIIPYGIGDCFNNCKGLEILERVLPMALTASSKYHSYFYYNKYEDMAVPFPYYMITSTKILQIAENYERAYVVSAKKICEYYRNYFEQAVKKCFSLLYVENDIFEIFKSYKLIEEANSCYTIAYQPCMVKFYTSELIEKKVRSDLPYREELIEECKKRFAVIENLTGDYYTFFTADGVREFADTGIIRDIPRQIITPLTKEERVMLLTNLRDSIADDTIMGRFVADGKLALPKDITICVNAKNKVDILSVPQNTQEIVFYSLYFEERILTEKFMDFMLFLPKSEYALSKEDTIGMIDEILSRL